MEPGRKVHASNSAPVVGLNLDEGPQLGKSTSHDGAISDRKRRQSMSLLFSLVSRTTSDASQGASSSGSVGSPNIFAKPRDELLDISPDLIKKYGRERCLAAVEIFFSPIRWNLQYSIKDRDLYDIFFEVAHSSLQNILLQLSDFSRVDDAFQTLVLHYLRAVVQVPACFFLQKNPHVKKDVQDLISQFRQVDCINNSQEFVDATEKIEAELPILSAEKSLEAGFKLLGKGPKEPDFTNQVIDLLNRVIKKTKGNSSSKNKLLFSCLSIVFDPSAKELLKNATVKLKYRTILNLTKKISDPNVQLLAEYVEKTLDYHQATFQVLMLFLDLMGGKARGSQNLAAGTRKWDLNGDLFFFFSSQIRALVAQQTELEIIKERDLLNGFLVHWVIAAANRDLMCQESFRRDWTYLSTLDREKGVKGSPAFVTEVSPSTPSPRKLAHPPLFSLEGEGSSPRDLACSPRGRTVVLNPLRNTPAKNLWEQANIVNLLFSSLIRYMTAIWFEVTVKDILTKESNENKITQHAKRFGDISRFVVEQILFCDKLELAHKKITVFCKVQKKLIKEGAFDIACAIHAGITNSAVARLKNAFKDIKNFEKYFDAPDSVTAASSDLKSIRKAQEEHPHPLEYGVVVRADVTHIEDGNPDFTDTGSLNLEGIELLGALLNQTIERQQRALAYWEKQQLEGSDYLEALFPRSLYKMKGDELFRKAREIEDFVLEAPGPGKLWNIDDVLWMRSNLIHHGQNEIYWGKQIKKRS